MPPPTQFIKSAHNEIKKRYIYFIIVSILSIATLAILIRLFLPVNMPSRVTNDDAPVPESQKPTAETGIDSTVMDYVYNAPESEKDSRYLYHWEILKAALEKTNKEFGPYRMISSKVMTEKRQLSELQESTGEITVMYQVTTQELESTLLPVRIPVDKNFGGYRVMLIRAEDQKKMNDIRTIDDFRELSIGQGYGWIDVDILKHNGFRIVTGSNYEGLFKMLANKRFDVFSRSAIEVQEEYEKRKAVLKDLRVEDSLLLYFPLPMYFWFTKNKDGSRLAQRVEKGMRTMIADGSYDELFKKYHGTKAEKLHLKKRRVFVLENPFLVSETPFQDHKLWYNPLN
jgi:ABC-type amino acid transport substrate-binding protein